MSSSVVHRRTALAVVALGLAIAPAARAEMVSLGAMKDATLYEDPQGGLANGAGQFFFAGRTGQPMFSTRRGLLAFDVASAVPAGATIDAVTLTLHAAQSNSTPYSVGLHALLADWGEGASDAPGGEGGGTQALPGDATWIHTVSPGSLWATPGGDFAAGASADEIVGAAGFYSWSSPQMAADVQGWLDAPGGNFGWALLGDETASGTARKFDSRDSGSAELRPVLLVEYSLVPAPGSALLLAAAGLLGRRRRR